MTPLSRELQRSLITTLLHTKKFGSNEELKTVFNVQELHEYIPFLRDDAKNASDRVTQTIQFLMEQGNKNGQSVLIVFLETLYTFVLEESDLYWEFTTLLEEVRQAIAPAPKEKKALPYLQETTEESRRKATTSLPENYLSEPDLQAIEEFKEEDLPVAPAMAGVGHNSRIRTFYRLPYQGFNALSTEKRSYVIIVISLCVLLLINLIAHKTSLFSSHLYTFLNSVMLPLNYFIFLVVVILFLLMLAPCIKQPVFSSFIHLEWKISKVFLSVALLLVLSNIYLTYTPQNSVRVVHHLKTIQDPIYSKDGIGLCDGRCALDTNRINGQLKVLAANELQQNHHNAACAYLNWAQQEDQADAEAKIDYADQCQQNGASLHCPCINYVAVISLVQENPPASESTDPAVYNNGTSRSILQGAYLQQQAWNNDHKAGPAMYIFVANVGDVTDATNASQWQLQIADQITQLSREEREHTINGVIGLPQGTETLIGQLDQRQIPMVSIASLKKGAITYPSLLSVAPSIDDEMTAAVYFLNKDIMQGKTLKNIGVLYYNNDIFPWYANVASAFRNVLPNNIETDQPYDDLPQYTTPSLQHLASNAVKAYDAIFFAGPESDLLTFLNAFRQKDTTTPVLTYNIAYQTVYTYLPPDKKVSLTGLYFTAFGYHATDLYNGGQTSPMIGEFKQAYDPTSVHSGNIYNYRLPSSDALLAYDALGVFTYLVNHYSGQSMPAWQDQRTFLAAHPPAMVSGKIQFSAAHSDPQAKTVLLLQIRSRVFYYYLDKYPGNGG